MGGRCLIPSASAAQGAAVPSLEKIPEPIKEATALFYGERRGSCTEVLVGAVLVPRAGW